MRRRKSEESSSRPKYSDYVNNATEPRKSVGTETFVLDSNFK